MKKILFSFLLVISSSTTLAADKWYMGVGYASYSTFNTDFGSGRNDIDDRLYSFYLTHGGNLAFTYRLSLRDRHIYQISTDYADGTQQLISADIIYNVASTASGLFFDIEAGITTPINTPSFTQNGALVEGQKDPGLQLGIGIGYTVSRSFTIRANSWMEYSSTQFSDGVDVTNAPQNTTGFELIYSW